MRRRHQVNAVCPGPVLGHAQVSLAGRAHQPSGDGQQGAAEGGGGGGVVRIVTDRVASARVRLCAIADSVPAFAVNEPEGKRAPWRRA